MRICQYDRVQQYSAPSNCAKFFSAPACLLTYCNLKRIQIFRSCDYVKSTSDDDNRDILNDLCCYIYVDCTHVHRLLNVILFTFYCICVNGALQTGGRSCGSLQRSAVFVRHALD